MIVIETERLLLRRPLLNDLDALAEISADPEVMKYITGNPSLSPGALRESLKAHAASFEQGGFGLLSVIDHGHGEFIGQCGLQIIAIEGKDMPVLSCMLNRGNWGKGLAFEALTAVRDHALIAMDMESLQALVHPDHQAGVRLAEKLGMSKQREVEVRGCAMQLFVARRRTES